MPIYGDIQAFASMSNLEKIWMSDAPNTIGNISVFANKPFLNRLQLGGTTTNLIGTIDSLSGNTALTNVIVQ